MKETRKFPPGVGWIPAGVAVVFALLVATVAAAPQFSTKIVGTKNGPVVVGTADPSVLGPSANPSAAPGGHTVVNPGAGGAATGPGGSAGSKRGCTSATNGGATAPGVTATEIHVASTIVTTGIGKGFLGEAADGMRAAIRQVDQSGGICGRLITDLSGKPGIETINDEWNPTQGQNDIQGWIQTNNVFALVGEPDSEGLGASITSQTIDRAGIPVVGTDGMLNNQYFDPWVWPVAASTVTNMHVIAKYAVEQQHANSFGIVYDSHYKFGREGANAFAQELKRLGKSVQGYSAGAADSCSGSTAYCGIDGLATDFSGPITAFNSACKPCDAVVMLLEPAPMINWMGAEQNGGQTWFNHLFGGEPLFDDKVGEGCPGCGKGGMTVWTGYHPAIQPFDGETPVYQYCQALHAVPGALNDDCHNEFTQGAYLGTMLFIRAAQKVGQQGLPLTRQNLRNALNSGSFDLQLTAPLTYSEALPHQANTCMAAFKENYSGSFNGWSYLSTGFLCDPAAGQDLR